MKQVLKLVNIPSPLDRNNLTEIERYCKFGGNKVKQDHQQAVRAVTTPQLPEGWNPIDYPVFLVFEYRFGEVTKRLPTRKNPVTVDHGSCDSSNVTDNKATIDALTLDRRRTLLGSFSKDRLTFKPRKTFKLAHVPDVMYDEAGEPVEILSAKPLNPKYGKKGQLLKRLYKTEFTLSRPIEDKKLFYPEPDQSHAVLVDDRRAFIPYPPLSIQVEIDSDNPGVDLSIYKLEDAALWLPDKLHNVIKEF